MPQKSNRYEEVTWDKKKIAVLISLVFIIGAGFFAAKKFLLTQTKNNVMGIQTSNNTPGFHSTGPAAEKSSFYLPTSQDIQQKIQGIQQQVAHLNVDEIASTSPQIKQIIQQLQDLPNLPKEAARNACEQLCKNIK